MRTNLIRNNESSLEHCLCAVCCPVYSSGLKIVNTYPPPANPYISETAFWHRFQKAYTPPSPRGNDILVHWTKRWEEPANMRIYSVLAPSRCPTEIYKTHQGP